MKANTYHFTIVFCFSLLMAMHYPSSVLAQPPDSLWYKAFGGTANEKGFAVMEDDNGNCIVVGSTESSGNGNYDIFLVKLDKNGDPVWTKTYGGALSEQANSISKAWYGGYIITGYTQTNANGISDLFILSVGENGDSLWSKKYGGMTSDQGYCIIQNVDQGYVLCGYSSVFGVGDQLYLLKTDNAGDTLWTKTFGGNYQDYGRCVIEDSQGDYIIAGNSYYSSSAEAGDAWVHKTDSDGTVIWSKRYGGDNEDIFYAALEMDEGYIFAGQTLSFGADVIDVYVVCTYFNGDTIWAKTYGGAGADYAYAISGSLTSGFYITGYSKSFNSNGDVYIIHISGDGDLIWEKNWGNDVDAERAYACASLDKNEFIVTGILDYYNQDQDDLFVLRLGEGGAGFAESHHSHITDLNAFPNPFTKNTFFRIDLSITSSVYSTIYDIHGNVVMTRNHGYMKSGTHELEWYCPDCPSGVYYGKIISGDRCFEIKMIKN